MVNLEPVVGHEQGRIRPCLVISDERFNNSKADLLIVLPLTSKEQKNLWAVKISPNASGLEKDSYILCSQILTISKKRILSNSPIGFVDQKYFNLIEERIKYLLSLV